MTTTVDALHERGRSALLHGRAVLDVPPGPGSRRWGLSVVIRPQPALAARLDEVTAELAALAGPGQWETGRADTSHLTLFTLEPHRPGVAADDPAARRYADATRRAAGESAPATFAVTGLAATPGGVVAACEPVDDAARALRPCLTAAMGGDVFEATYRGDQWWLSLLHLAAPLPSPSGLVGHIEGRRTEALGLIEARSLELVRYDHRTGPGGPRMVPVPLETVALSGVRAGGSDGTHA